MFLKGGVSGTIEWLVSEFALHLFIVAFIDGVQEGIPV